MLKKVSFWIFLLVILSFVHSESVFAQSVGIKISPVKIEDIVDPGQTFKSQLTVQNESDSARTFYVYLKDFKAGDENGSPKLIAPGSEDGYYLASWIDITSEGIEFAPHEEKSIPFNVNVPDNVGPGGYFGGIYFGTKPPRLEKGDEDKGAGMSISQQAGSLLLLRVKGEVDERAEVREFNTDKNYYNTPFDVNFLVRIENKGNVHVKPYGTIEIEDMFGRSKASIMINEKGGNVLPHSIRKYNSTWSDKYGFGKYTATLGLTYGENTSSGGQGKQTLYSQKTFWIIPWKIVTPFLIGFAVVFILFFISVRFYKEKAVKRAMERAGVKHTKKKISNNGQSSFSHFMMLLMIVMSMAFLLVAGVYFIFFA